MKTYKESNYSTDSLVTYDHITDSSMSLFGHIGTVDNGQYYDKDDVDELIEELRPKPNLNMFVQDKETKNIYFVLDVSNTEYLILQTMDFSGADSGKSYQRQLLTWVPQERYQDVPKNYQG